MRNKVLIVGYHPQIPGGITTVMALLCKSIPYLELHASLRCYRPRLKALLNTLISLFVFSIRLLTAPPRVVHVIVGSKGDTLRTLPYLVFARMRGCSVCLHFHKNRAGLFEGMPGAVRGCVMYLWRLASAYCFLSGRLRDEFAGQLNSRVPHRVIPNPIGDLWLNAANVPARDRGRDLVFLGRWCSEKGVDELVSAMGSLDCGHRVKCDVFSDYSSTNHPRNCVLHDWLQETEVRQVLRDTRVLLLPSHFEAFPTVLLEAAACGTPFVATRIAGIPDIAEQSGAGLLHEVGDVDGMQKAITRLLTDDALWQQFSENGKRWVQSLEVSQVVPHWHRLYGELGIQLHPSLEVPPLGARARR